MASVTDVLDYFDQQNLRVIRANPRGQEVTRAELEEAFDVPEEQRQTEEGPREAERPTATSQEDEPSDSGDTSGDDQGVVTSGDVNVDADADADADASDADANANADADANADAASESSDAGNTGGPGYESSGTEDEDNGDNE